MANAAQPAQKSRRTLIVALASAALVVALGIVAVVVTKKDSSSDETVTGVANIETSDVTVTGASLVTPPEAPAVDPAIGAKAPALNGLGFDGSAVSVTPGNRPTIVMFVAHWCPHCQAEVPIVAKYLADKGSAARQVAGGRCRRRRRHAGRCHFDRREAAELSTVELARRRRLRRSDAPRQHGVSRCVRLRARCVPVLRGRRRERQRHEAYGR